MSNPRPASRPHGSVAVAASAPVALQWGGVDPAGIGAPGRATASFLLVLCVAGIARRRRPALLRRSVDAVLERPLRAPLYGLVAAIVGTVVAAYVLGQVGRLGGDIGRAAAALGVGGALVACGFGFVVVGTGTTAALGDRRPWTGSVVGASVSAAVILALPTLPGAAVWVLIAATGLGGSARRWLHATRSVERAGEGSS